MPALIAKIKGRWQPKPGEPKITRGHINRAINYILEHEPGKERPRVIGGQGLEYQITNEETARRAGRDMEDLGNPSAPGPRPNPLFHMILSWEDNPTDEHMVEAGRSALQHLGMERAQGVFVRHHNTNNHHMHFVGSRVDPETGVTFRSMQNWSKDRTRLDEWRRDREREYKREHARPLDQDRQRQGFENLSAAMEYLASGAKDNVRGNNRFEEVPVPEGGDGFRLGVTLDKQGGRRLDIEMVDFEQRGTGAFTRYLDHMESESIKHRFSGIGVNDIVNSRLEKFLQRRGYGELSNDSPNPLKSLFKPREAFERGMEPALERPNDHTREQREQTGQLPFDRSWLKTPENFREFADAHGLGRVSQQEVQKLIRDHANEKMLSDFNYFSKLDRDKPERTPTLEHQNENTEGMPFYSPAGAKVVNRVLNEREHTDWNELQPVEKVATIRDKRERGGGRERSIFDDGSAAGESGYGGD